MLKCQRDKFQLQRKYAYLNCAYMSPLSKKVVNAGRKGIKSKTKPFHITSEDFFKLPQAVRILFSQLISCTEPDRIAIIPSAAYGMANVINNIPFKSGEVVIAHEQFPSNVYPWDRLVQSGFKIKTVAPPNSQNRGAAWNEEILNAIHTNTRVVAMGHVHWCDGTIFLLEEIRKKLDEVGGLLVIDGTQSVGALPFSIQKYRPDALVCAAYKWLMGPYAIGLAYYGKVFDKGIPIEESWINRTNSYDFEKLLDYTSDYHPKAARYNMGEYSNFILIPMLQAGLQQILKWQPVHIQSYCKNLMHDAIEELKALGLRIESSSYQAGHIIGIHPMDQIPLDAFKTSFHKHRVSVSMRGKIIRISPHIYNDRVDVDKLVKSIKETIFAFKNKS